MVLPTRSPEHMTLHAPLTHGASCMYVPDFAWRVCFIITSCSGPVLPDDLCPTLCLSLTQFILRLMHAHSAPHLCKYWVQCQDVYVCCVSHSWRVSGPCCATKMLLVHARPGACNSTHQKFLECELRCCTSDKELWSAFRGGAWKLEHGR